VGVVLLHQPACRHRRLARDVAGVVLLSIATSCLIFFTDFGGDSGHGSGSSLTRLFGAGLVVAATAFVSTNNYFHEVGTALGVAVFGTIFTSRLSDSLAKVFSDFGAKAQSTASLDPQLLSTVPAPVRNAIVTAYADSLAPVFWYLIPFLGMAYVLALTLKEIPLSDTAGLVARAEAIGGAEAERLHQEQAVVTQDR
jgi:hypothetical protein